jgi:hypothetical protein
MIRLWDSDEQAFHIGSHILEIDIEDVHFLMGLSKRGAPIILSKHWSTPLPTDAYVSQ